MNNSNPQHKTSTLHPDVIADLESDERIRQMFRDMGVNVRTEGFGIIHNLGDTGSLLTLGIAAGQAKEDLTNDE